MFYSHHKKTEKTDDNALLIYIFLGFYKKKFDFFGFFVFFPQNFRLKKDKKMGRSIKSISIVTGCY